MRHCIQGRAEATQVQWSTETTPCQSGCQIILKIFLLASIKFFQKFIENMFFLFELCRNHLQAIKSYRLPERGGEGEHTFILLIALQHL